ncbi:metallophosphoesterase [Paucibacter sp. XJ19-41]|uniref:metallophosphoesterase n=1 Tax=Paucibacter sp. XJ19-41 TaxID=2927824 RepID=UPI00234A8255|nr:metallophosphoesterase [Paucibacter sp. XJ19-41]MDC6168877.1 metallophosphoesterase [Paucibacter sp. XJ19-41]
MRLQLISDLHLETESYEPRPAPGAELLVLAGDVDSTWRGLELFRDWPVPVLFVPGNHEYDGRDVDSARTGLHALARELGFLMLDDASLVINDGEGRRVRFVGSTRWSDFDLFGSAQRERAMRAAGYFQRVMAATRNGHPFDAAAVRDEALRCRDWLAQQLALGEQGPGWDATVVITHFAPSIQSADPRYGRQPGTASFCNDDEALLGGARLWLHGHLHCRHDYRLNGCRVLCNARGHARKGEADGHDGQRLIEVFDQPA